MIGPQRTALALGASLGSPVRPLAFIPWHSVTFAGIKMVAEIGTNLPTDIEEREFDVPGFVVADVAQVTPTRAEFLLIRA